MLGNDQKGEEVWKTASQSVASAIVNTIETEMPCCTRFAPSISASITSGAKWVFAPVRRKTRKYGDNVLQISIFMTILPRNRPKCVNSLPHACHR